MSKKKEKPAGRLPRRNYSILATWGPTVDKLRKRFKWSTSYLGHTLVSRAAKDAGIACPVPAKSPARPIRAVSRQHGRPRYHFCLLESFSPVIDALCEIHQRSAVSLLQWLLSNAAKKHNIPVPRKP